MAVRSPKYYYLVIHDTHKLLLWGSEVVWDPGLIHSKLGKVLALSLFACLFGFVQLLPASTLPQTKWNRFSFLLFLEELLEGICMSPQSLLMYRTCNCHFFFSYWALGTWTTQACMSAHTKTPTSTYACSTEASMFSVLTLCPAALHWGVEVERLSLHVTSFTHKPCRAHAHTASQPRDSTSHTITQPTYCSQTNTMHYLPRSCSSLPHNQAHASS